MDFKKLTRKLIKADYSHIEKTLLMRLKYCVKLYQINQSLSLIDIYTYKHFFLNDSINGV